MKKMVLFFLIGLFLISFVIAAQNQVQNQQQNNGIGQQLSEQIQERRQEIREGDYNLPQGQLLQVRELAQEQKELRVRNVSARTSLNISVGDCQVVVGGVIDPNGTVMGSDACDWKVIRAQLGSGDEREIVIMPDVAAETARDRLRLKVCSEENNCTLQLREIGQANQVRAAYEVQVERHYRILGLFQAKAQNRVQIDAENGEVVQIGKPWWSFLATSD